MKLSIISFTENGRQLSEEIAKGLKGETERKIEVDLFTKCDTCKDENRSQSISFVEGSVKDWAREQMGERNGILFIGACGIAVRAIAPFLTDKLHDAPILVMDEKGKYSIPILSGHMGGANELAVYLSKKMGAEAVITTATDLNEKFAVDLFAKRNGLFIVNTDGIVKVSSKVLAGKEITVSIETGHEGKESNLPEGVNRIPYPPDKPVDIVVTSKEGVFNTAVLLKPREYIIGMGCKRGKKTDEIEKFVLEKIRELGISTTQILALSSISQKQDEQGMVTWCRKEGILFLTYNAEELQKVKGNFKKSSFVKERVGVDNVCERAALLACGVNGKLIDGKHAKDGMTIAVAKREWKVEFYGE